MSEQHISRDVIYVVLRTLVQETGTRVGQALAWEAQELACVLGAQDPGALLERGSFCFCLSSAERCSSILVSQVWEGSQGPARPCHPALWTWGPELEGRSRYNKPARSFPSLVVASSPAGHTTGHVEAMGLQVGPAGRWRKQSQGCLCWTLASGP